MEEDYVEYDGNANPDEVQPEQRVSFEEPGVQFGQAAEASNEAESDGI